MSLGREAALKDDFTLENNYGYDDEDEEWGNDDDWKVDDEAEGEEATDVKDEGTAYLEFLNEEVRFIFLSGSGSVALSSLPNFEIRLLLTFVRTGTEVRR